MRRFAVSALVGFAASVASATPPVMTPPPPTAPPALTVVIAVDGLSSTTFDRFRSQFRDGLARLAGGARFELAPGTGSLLGDAQSLSSVLKQARPGSRVLVVAGSAAAAASVSDKSSDQSWLFSGSRFAAQGAGSDSATAARANSAIAKAIATPEPPLEPPLGCAAPPLSTSGKRFARAEGDGTSYQASPQMDGTTLAVALALASDLDLGSTSARADVVAVGLGATAAVVAAYSAASQEMCLNLVSLDRDLGDAFAYLDRTGTDYALVLAGISNTVAPLFFWRKGWIAPATGGPARRVDVVPTIAAMVGAPVDPAASPGACLSGMPGVICPPKR